MSSIKIEGVTISEILDWTPEYWDSLVLLDRPITMAIGSAEILGQFAIKENRLLVELAQIDGGGEGILPAISRISKRVVQMYDLDGIDCIVHALNCARPNLKLRYWLEKNGFEVRDIPHKGEAYFKQL